MFVILLLDYPELTLESDDDGTPWTFATQAEAKLYATLYQLSHYRVIRLLTGDHAVN
jgi:hypothetical protein